MSVVWFLCGDWNPTLNTFEIFIEKIAHEDWANVDWRCDQTLGQAEDGWKMRMKKALRKKDVSENYRRILLKELLWIVSAIVWDIQSIKPEHLSINLGEAPRYECAENFRIEFSATFLLNSAIFACSKKKLLLWLWVVSIGRQIRLVYWQTIHQKVVRRTYE